MAITIIGLGPGDPGLLTRQAWEILSQAKEVYLRTKIHPTVNHLPEGVVYHSFDDLYQAAENFSQIYDSIVQQLIKLAGQSEVIYAVPGDPMIAEGTVTRLLTSCKEQAIPIKIISGISFIEPSLAALGIDGISGLQLIDALDLVGAHHPPINPDAPALIAQVYNQQVASEVKLTLMNQYPDEHPVILLHHVGLPDERLQSLPLYEIDRQDNAHLTTLYVPRFNPAPEAVAGFQGFQETVAYLRAPDGCPWDREQTHQTLRKHLLEETYEVIEAIDADDIDRLKEELGDLLLQVVLHAQIAVDEGEFYMAEVIQYIDAKLKRRHPHVWGEVDVNDSPEQVKVNWEQIKAAERAENGEPERSLLDGIPKSLPALAQAHEYDARAARVGFDWPDIKGVLEKFEEELKETYQAETPEELFHEIGDLLFVIAVWARWLKLNPEDALRAANRRFYDRFTHIERRAREQGRELSTMSLEEMDSLWNEAKMNARKKQ